MTVSPSPDISVIVPNYNGQGIIAECLSSIPAELEVTVVDDASSDDSVAQISSAFPQVRLVCRESNSGFSAAVNDGIRQTGGDFVVLLNNDVRVSPEFLESIVPLFADESLFAVSPRILLPNRGDADEGAKTGFWRHGMFYVDQRQGVPEVSPILYATGCAAVYRRSMLEELGGFDEAYSPFYWEDADLGYRAWKRGWKTVYQPASAVVHRHAASVSRLDPAFTSRIKARNGLFFVWRNIEDKRLLAAHRRWLVPVLVRRIVAGDRAFVAGLRDAWRRRGEAAEARMRDSAHRRLSDSEIFDTVGIRHK